MAEIRAHLKDDIAAEMAGGRERDDAERIVIERLGPPERLAGQFPPHGGRRFTPVWIAAAVVVIAAAVAGAFAVTDTRHAAPAPTSVTWPTAHPVVPVGPALVVFRR